MKNMFKTLKQSNRMEKKKLSKNKYKKKARKKRLFLINA